MKAALRWIAIALAASLLAASPAPPGAAIPMDSSSAGRLDALANQYWQRQLGRDFFLRFQIGKPIDTIRPVTYAIADDDARFAESILHGLAQIDPRALDHDRWLTYRTLQYLANNDVAGRTYFWLRQQATPYAGGLQIGTLATIFADFKFGAPDDAKRYESLLEQYAALISSLRELLAGQHERHVILPVAEIDATQAVYEGYTQPAASDALIPSADRLQGLSAADRTALQTAAKTIVTSKVVPAFASVAVYLKGDYRAGAPTAVGLAQYAGGLDYYRFLVRSYTTLDTTPEKLHALGLEEVARLNAHLEEIAHDVGFNGSVAAFKQHLAHDPQFFVKTPAQFGERLETYVQRSGDAAPNFFAQMPKAPYGVAPLPEALAGAQTFGYYDQPNAARPKGLYYYNAWHPERASTLSAGALICHELIPGHHFQIALQQENTALPDVRHYDFSETGFVEGWGEYASQLCWDMGVYQTPYDKAGRLMQDLMVSVRLVVDTGMNAMGWSRERAMHYMRENLTISDSQIASESLRYSTDIPGQALAYKTGELTLLQIREHARKRLGKTFAIKDFHSWVLDSGSMTLDTLRAHVDYEIERSLKGSRAE